MGRWLRCSVQGCNESSNTGEDERAEVSPSLLFRYFSYAWAGPRFLQTILDSCDIFKRGI